MSCLVAGVPLNYREAFVSSVMELLADAGRRTEMVRAAYAFVRERYAMDRVVDAFEQQ